MSRLKNIVERFRESGFTGRLLATILVSSTHQTIWPVYLWLHRAWIGFGWPTTYAWGGAAVYFALWSWLIVLLTREGRLYRGMVLDAISCGALLAVAAALHDPGAQQSMAEIGFSGTAWVVFLSSAVLVLGKAVQRNQQVTGRQAAPQRA